MRAGVEDRGLQCGQRSATVAGSLRQRASGRDGERAEVRARRVDEHAVERAADAARRRRRCAPRRSSRPSARRCAASASARPGWRSTATISPALPISAARCVVLPPGAAHRSSTRSPGCGRERARDRHRGARLRHEQAVAPTAARRTRRTAPSRTSPSGSASAACDATGSCAASVVAVDPQRVGAQRRPRRARCRRPSAPARRRRRARRTTARRSSAGASGAARPAAGVPSGSAATSAARLARRAPQHGVDEAGAARRVGLGQLDRLADGGVRRDAVEERRAGRPRAAARRARRARARWTRRSASVSITWSSVARALDGAVRELRRERAIARVEPRRGLAVQRAVGPGSCSNTRRTTAYAHARARRDVRDVTARVSLS